MSTLANPILFLDILNYMDQGWPKIAAEAATKPASSVIPTVYCQIPVDTAKWPVAAEKGKCW